MKFWHLKNMAPISNTNFEYCDVLVPQNIHVLIMDYFGGLLLDCINSIANALELQQSCATPSNCSWYDMFL